MQAPAPVSDSLHHTSPFLLNCGSDDVHRLYFFYYYENPIVNVLSNIAIVSNRVNLSRTVKPCSAGDRSGISVKCNLGWSSQPSLDLRQHFRGYSSPSEAVLTAQSDLRKLFVGNEKIGVLLLNLGGPETLDDVQPFLFNLFADPVINILQSNTCFYVFDLLFFFHTIITLQVYQFWCKNN